MTGRFICSNKRLYDFDFYKWYGMSPTKHHLLNVFEMVRLAGVHARTNRNARARARVRARAHTHTHIQTYTDMPTHTQTHIQRIFVSFVQFVRVLIEVISVRVGMFQVV